MTPAFNQFPLQPLPNFTMFKVDPKLNFRSLAFWIHIINYLSEATLKATAHHNNPKSTVYWLGQHELTANTKGTNSSSGDTLHNTAP